VLWDAPSALYHAVLGSPCYQQLPPSFLSFPPGTERENHSQLILEQEILRARGYVSALSARVLGGQVFSLRSPPFLSEGSPMEGLGLVELDGQRRLSVFCIF